MIHYIIAAVTGGVLGALMPSTFKNISLKIWVAALIGVLCGLIGYQGASTMSMTLFGAAWWPSIAAAFLGVLIVGLNLNSPYFTPKFPRISTVIRLFLGLFMFSSGLMMMVVYFTKLQYGETLAPADMDPNPVFDWLQAVIETGFLWQWIFIFKMLFGLLVLIPRTSTVGILGALPYYVNITIYTVCLAQLWLFLSIPAIVATLFLVYTHWDYYKRFMEK